MDTGTTAFDTKIVAALIGALATVSIFFLGKFIELMANLRDRKVARSRMLNALYTEIAHNVEEMAIAFLRSPSPEAIVPLLEEKQGRTVHAVYARNMRFYEAFQEEIHVLPPIVVDAIVRFYNSLQSVYAVLEGFERDSFINMTYQGKHASLHNLADEIKSATTRGRKAMFYLEINFDEIRRAKRRLSAIGNRAISKELQVSINSFYDQCHLLYAAADAMTSDKYRAGNDQVPEGDWRKFRDVVKKASSSGSKTLGELENYVDGLERPAGDSGIDKTN